MTFFAWGRALNPRWDDAFARPAWTGWASPPAVAIGRAGTRDVIVSGSDDSTVRIWDAISGDMTGMPLAGHDDGGERHGGRPGR